VDSDFNQLRVYRYAVELADEIYMAVEHWPILARTTIGTQLIRSIDSVGPTSLRQQAAMRQPTGGVCSLLLAVPSTRPSIG
jgi:hypothetical protein